MRRHVAGRIAGRGRGVVVLLVQGCGKAMRPCFGDEEIIDEVRFRAVFVGDPECDDDLRADVG